MIRFSHKANSWQLRNYHLITGEEWYSNISVEEARYWFDIGRGVEI